jgi:hypothetical protein
VVYFAGTKSLSDSMNFFLNWLTIYNTKSYHILFFNILLNNHKNNKQKANNYFLTSPLAKNCNVLPMLHNHSAWNLAQASCSIAHPRQAEKGEEDAHH